MTSSPSEIDALAVRPRESRSELATYLATVEIEVDGVRTRFADYTADTTRPR